MPTLDDIDSRSTVRRLAGELNDALATLSADVAGEARSLLPAQDEIPRMTRQEAEARELALRSFCFRHRLSRVLAAAGVPHPYDFQGEFEENSRPNDRPPADPVAPGGGWRLLGFDVGYPIGVPASPLTAKKSWIDYFSGHGFNIFTYKTVRTGQRDPLPFPNWVYLRNLDAPLPLDIDPSGLVAEGNLATYLSRANSYSTANSFGVPSSDPTEWQAEVATIEDALPRGKLLIVSVMGNEDLIGDDGDVRAFIADFVDVAQRAARAGARAIELNLSCPNKLDREGAMMRPICETPDLTAEIVEAVRQGVPRDVPIVAKLSYLNFEDLSALLPRIVEHVAGISGINTLQVPVVDPGTSEPTFQGRDREGRLRIRRAAGVSGVALRYFALDFVESLNRLRRGRGWTYDILAMGGVMDAHDVRALMAAGADCVQAATAATTNPRLPLQVQSPGSPESVSPSELKEIRAIVLDERGELRTPSDVARRLELHPDAIRSLFEARQERDLPRFVAELLALRRSGGEVAEPTHGAFSLSAALSEVQHRRLLDASLRVSEAAQRLGVSDDEVHAMIERSEIIAVGEGDATRVPVWQFAGSPATVIDGVPEVARSFPAPLEALETWMTTPHPDLAGMTPLKVIIRGERDRVLRLLRAIGAAGR